jgi:hypothetical protein
MDFFPVQVMLPGLPLILWSDEVFKEIGNSLGLFCEVDNSYYDYGYMGVARILVRMDLSKELAKSIIIRKGPAIFYKPLHYKGIHFKCGRWHIHGHLANECPLSNKRKV